MVAVVAVVAVVATVVVDDELLGAGVPDVGDGGEVVAGAADVDVPASEVVVAGVPEGEVDSEGDVGLVSDDDAGLVSDVDDELVPSMTGIGSQVSGEDGSTGSGSPGGGSVAAGFCSTTL